MNKGDESRAELVRTRLSLRFLPPQLRLLPLFYRERHGPSILFLFSFSLLLDKLLKK
jgi:hypothetical protein